MTILLLIRHGQNDWMGTNRLAGRTPGVHLNEKGQAQAQDLVQRLGQQPITAVYSSPLERCLETARPLADHLGQEVILHAGVMEADMGQWQGANLKELAKLPAWQMVQHHPSGFRFPDGESLREVQNRMVAALEQIAANHPKEVVAVFSHSDVIKTAVAHFIGTPLDLFQRIMIDTASVSVIGLHKGIPHVIRVNDNGPLPVFKREDAVEEAKEDDEDAQADSHAHPGAAVDTAN